MQITLTSTISVGEPENINKYSSNNNCNNNNNNNKKKKKKKKNRKNISMWHACSLCDQNSTVTV